MSKPVLVTLEITARDWIWRVFNDDGEEVVAHMMVRKERGRFQGTSKGGLDDKLLAMYPENERLAEALEDGDVMDIAQALAFET